MIVVVSGSPGSGKTSLAKPLAAALGLPLIAKDTVKEALSVLELPATICDDSSRKLGFAAFEVVFALIEEIPDAVVEASWNPKIAAERLARLDRTIIEVSCKCPPEIARRRYAARAPSRHWVHMDARRLDDDTLWPDDGAVSKRLSESVIAVDTTRQVDIPGLVARIEGLA